ncbi:MAG TPA: cellulase family glycosylhydrolase [Phnomibacter sp.]|nr:cellulase family glycosylhydrolase [Phnomibacter sp.]
MPTFAMFSISFKKLHAYLIVLVGLIALPFVTNCQGFLKAEGGKIVNASGQNVLLRGMGLGGWMLQEGYMLRVNGIGQQQHSIRQHIEKLVGKEKTEAIYNNWLLNHTTRKDIEAMKKWGFNSVRLPMHYNLYTLPVAQEKVKGKNTWLKKGFEMTDSLLAWCKDNQMYLILDLHGAPGGQGHDLNISDANPNEPFLWESPENQEKTIALWKELANRYKNETWIGGYDILNEPNWGFTDSTDKNGLKEAVNAPLKELLVNITKAIRSVDPHHIIIIEGNGWGNNYSGMLPPWDSNMVLSFHKYWNYNNTDAIQTFLNYREKYNVPIWLGETGENSNVWFTQAIRLMEANNIGWCWWPLKKIGINNPLEITSNPEYDSILAYWSGKGAAPTAATAWKGLSQLAASSHFSKNIVHADVIDAMFRQINTQNTRPVLRQPVQPGTVIPAVEYDLGRNGSAYYDSDTADYHISDGTHGGNKFRTFRNDGVDIKKDGKTPVVSGIENGEWLQYTIEVAKAGNYSIGCLVSGTAGEITISIPSNGKPVAVSVPVNTNSKDWQWVHTKPIALSKGKQVLRIAFPVGGFDFKEIQFQLAN